MGIKICSNEAPLPFPRVDNYEIAKFKKSSSVELLGQFQSSLAWSILGWRGFNFGEMKNNNHSILTKEFVFSFSNQWYDIIICVDLNWFLRCAMWPMGLLLNFDELERPLFFISIRNVEVHFDAVQSLMERRDYSCVWYRNADENIKRLRTLQWL